MRKIFISFLALAVFLSAFAGCTIQQDSELPSLSVSEPSTISKTDISSTNDSTSNNASMTIHVIDVGQGHSVLVESAGEFMLVDTGESEYSSTVMNYLNSQGVKKLKYAIATHPHSDHMGGFDKIIKNYDITTFMMPNAQIIHPHSKKCLLLLPIKIFPSRFLLSVRPMNLVLFHLLFSPLHHRAMRT